MPPDPNRLSGFWQELKRRRVIHVIIVYATAAYVIIELINNITEPLNLPEWTPTLVIVLLLVGFPIAIIFSWIFDVTPGGIEKTRSSDELKPDEKPKVSNFWKIASIVSFVIILGLLAFNLFGGRERNKEEILDKSIAVLPFRNDSPDEEKMYFINATMEAITDHLCKIKDLRVPGRTSVEQYRDNPKPISLVAKEMNVSYILDGSGHRDGDHVRLVVQLLDGKKDQHLWSKTYDAEIGEIFSMQIEIAQSIAEEIEAIITPEELKLIEKIPTRNFSALDYYQRGKEEYWNYSLEGNMEALNRAEKLYYEALELDPKFAQAYTGLARVYWDKHLVESYFDEDFMDSVIMLTNKALSYDDQLAEAYSLRGSYYDQTGKPDKALREYNKAISLNPNDWSNYEYKGRHYRYIDMVQCIENYQKAVFLNRGPQLSSLLKALGKSYEGIGFNEKSVRCHQEAFKLNGDSITYYYYLFLKGSGSEQDRLEYTKKRYELDTTDYDALYYIGYTYFNLGQYDNAFTYVLKWLEKDHIQSVHILQASWHRIGYLYWKNGYKEEAERYFDQQIEYCEKLIELGRDYAHSSYWAYYDLAGVYAFREEKEKSFENLRIYNTKKIMPRWMVHFIKEDPLFENIRDEYEFQQIVREVESKYQAEHERVKQWLEENDML